MDKLKTKIKHSFSADLVPMIWGPSGIGKTASVYQYCEENNLKFIHESLGQINALDFRGAPYPDEEKKTLTWLRPEFLPHPDEKAPGIIFIDEVGREDKEMRNVLLQFLDKKRVGRYKLPANWNIICAGNIIDESDYDIEELGRAMRNRLMHIYPEIKISAWLERAKIDNIHKFVYNFIKIYDNFLLQINDSNETSYPSPRSWYKVSNLLHNENIEEIIEMMSIVDIIGKKAGYKFMRYIEENLSFSFKDIIYNFQDIEIKNKLKNQDRSKLFEFNVEIAEYLKEIPVEEIKDKMLENIVDYFKETESTDEIVAGFIKNILTNDKKESVKLYIKISKYFSYIIKRLSAEMTL